jgi:hypothetical protein
MEMIEGTDSLHEGLSTEVLRTVLPKVEGTLVMH